jgi:hypothetical protein
MQTACPVKLDVNGSVVDVPGLYRCVNCQQLINLGIISSNITQEEALDWLAAIYVPQVTTVLLLATLGIRPLPQAYREILGQRVSDAIDLIHDLVAQLGGYGPEDPEAEEDTPSLLEQALASLEVGPDMRATYACPECQERHDVEALFEMLDEPDANAA